MRQLRGDLWTNTSLVSQETTYGSAKAQMDRLYSQALAGDRDAASELTGGATTFLDASKLVSGDYAAYMGDFYAVQAMLGQLETSAASQADTVQTELAWLEQQYEIQASSDKTLTQLKAEVMEAQSAFERVEEEQRAELALLQEQYGVTVNSDKTLAEMRDEVMGTRSDLEAALAEQAAAYERWGFEAVAPGIAGLEAAYLQAVQDAVASEKALNDALLEGLTTQMEIDSLRAASKMDELRAALDAARADQSSVSLQMAESLARQASVDEARLKAESLAENAVKLAEKALAQIGGYAGSQFSSELELLEAKVRKMNAGLTLGEGQTAGGWTVTNVKEYIDRKSVV